MESDLLVTEGRSGMREGEERGMMEDSNGVMEGGSRERERER